MPPAKKYSDELILKIDSLLKDGMKPKDIAKRLNIEKEYVHSVNYGNIGNDLTGRFKDNATEDDKELILKIHEMIKDGVRYEDIAKSTGITERRVTYINHGKWGSNYTKIVYKKPKPVSFEGIIKPYAYTTRLMTLFLRNISKEPHPKNCNLWMGTKNNQGYGTTNVKGKHTKAHRLSYELYKGKIPKGKFVCHDCDNPSCVNSDHLFLDNHKGNMKDRDKKNRQSKGERHGTAKLTDKDIPEIINLLDVEKKSYDHIAEKYDVHPMTIRAIDNGINWSHKSMRTKKPRPHRKKKS